MRKRVEMKAVYDRDLENVLGSLGILDKLVERELNCAVCGSQVDQDNLGPIFPEDDEIRVSCDNGRCIRIIATRGAATSSA